MQPTKKTQKNIKFMEKEKFDGLEKKKKRKMQ